MPEKENIEYCADVVANYSGSIVIVIRKNFPQGYALPGGRKKPKESFEDCAKRECREETGLDVDIKYCLGTYDAPDRDPRGRKISKVFVGDAFGTIKDERGKTKVILLEPDSIRKNKERFVFDHYKILQDYLAKFE